MTAARLSAFRARRGVRGASVAEYVVAAALVIAVVFVGLRLFGATALAHVEQTNDCLSGGGCSAPGGGAPGGGASSGAGPGGAGRSPETATTSPTASSSADPPPSAAPPAESGGFLSGVGDFFGDVVEGAVKGDLVQDPSLANVIGQTLGGEIPIVGWASDARDWGAAFGDVLEGREGGWGNLGLSTLAFLPFGSTIKNVAKGADVASSAARHADHDGGAELQRLLDRPAQLRSPTEFEELLRRDVPRARRAPLDEALPPGSTVLRRSDGDSWVVYRNESGKVRMRFRAEEARTYTEAAPGRNYTTDAEVAINVEGRAFVLEGRHRAVGAAHGDAIDPELGGVPGQPGVLDYEFYDHVSKYTGVPVSDLEIDYTDPDVTKAEADRRFGERYGGRR